MIFLYIKSCFKVSAVIENKNYIFKWIVRYNICQILQKCYNYFATMNNKRSNFKRLAEARTEKVLSMLDLIGNLSNKSFYEYTDEEVEKIFRAITESVESNKNKFKKNKDNKKRRFTLWVYLGIGL